VLRGDNGGTVQCTGGDSSRSTRTQGEPHGGRYWVLRDDSGGTCYHGGDSLRSIRILMKDSVQCGVFL